MEWGKGDEEGKREARQTKRQMQSPEIRKRIQPTRNRERIKHYAVEGKTQAPTNSVETRTGKELNPFEPKWKRTKGISNYRKEVLAKRHWDWNAIEQRKPRNGRSAEANAIVLGNWLRGRTEEISYSLFRKLRIMNVTKIKDFLLKWNFCY